MRWYLTALSTLVLLAATGLPVRGASAQAFGPPMTVFGSVTDSAGQVPEDLVVEAFVGQTVCGKGKTQFTGEGAGRVTVYFADVVSREQTAGCGASGSEVRIKIGDRFATQTVRWQAGPMQLDVVFGSATPAAIPTFTPAPTRTPTPTRAANAVTPTPGGPTPSGTAAQGTTTGTATAGASGTATAGTPTIPGTIRGGLGSPSAPSTGGNDDDGGGFPIWGAVLLVIAGIALVGGGVGFLMAQSRKDRDANP
ncbi:MAG: hypothetical protein ACKVVT_03345 [Dehalococcoidia bacterium]